MLRLIAILSVLAVLAACSNPSTRVFEDGGEQLEFSDTQRKAADAEIDRLGSGKDPDDIEGQARYSEAVTRLTGRGSKVEPQLIERLAVENDWAIRMGMIEVLGSVGTRRCIPVLIRCTNDPVPLVALHADKLLVGMTGHRVIPATGASTSSEGIPPVPQRGPDNLELDAEEKIWARWHAEHGTALQRAWEAWWKANRGTAEIK